MLTEMLATRDSLPTTRYCAIVLHFAALKPARWGHRAPPLSAKFRLGRNDSMERLGRAIISPRTPTRVGRRFGDSTAGGSSRASDSTGCCA